MKRTGQRTRALLALLADIGGAIPVLAVIVSAFAAIVWWLFFADLAKPTGRLRLGFLVGFALGAATYGAATVVYVRRFQSLRGYRWRSASYNFVFAPSDPRHQTNEVRITFEATRRGVRIFENRFRWTGSGRPAVPVVTSDRHELLGALYRDNHWLRYYIYLGRELERFVPETIELHQTFFDREFSVLPHHAKTVMVPVRELAIATTFPDGLVPNEVDLVHYKSDAPGARVLERRTIQIARGGNTATYDVERPKLHHRYAIEWAWPHTGPETTDQMAGVVEDTSEERLVDQG